MKKVQPWTDHPAKFSNAVLDTVAPIIKRRHRGTEGLDPFAGTGRIHELAERCDVQTWGMEIEPEGACMHPRTILGNSRELRKIWIGLFAWALSSPGYGNRMSDHHKATEICKACKGTGRVSRKKCERCKGEGRNTYKRHTYRHSLPKDRELHVDNSGRMQFGPAYCDLHMDVWRNLFAYLQDGGYFYLNVKNHFRTIKGEQVEVDVVGWHIEACESIGFKLLEEIPVKTPGMGHGANREARADCEWVLVLRKPLKRKK